MPFSTLFFCSMAQGVGPLWMASIRLSCPLAFFHFQPMGSSDERPIAGDERVGGERCRGIYSQTSLLLFLEPASGRVSLWGHESRCVVISTASACSKYLKPFPLLTLFFSHSAQALATVFHHAFYKSHFWVYDLVFLPDPDQTGTPPSQSHPGVLGWLLSRDQLIKEKVNPPVGAEKWD